MPTIIQNVSSSSMIRSNVATIIPMPWKYICSSGGAGTRLPEYSTCTWIFLGHPNPTFSDFWVNFMQIFGYPKELPDFFGTRIRLSLLFRLPDPTRTRLFTTRTIRYPTFCYPIHHNHTYLPQNSQTCLFSLTSNVTWWLKACKKSFSSFLFCFSCIFKCFFMFDLTENCFPHIEHLKNT